MADSDRVKLITDQLEATYQNLRVAASNLSGLLNVGRATCDEIKAYNLWALATYNAQRGMLDTLRAEGEQGVPDAPEYPTLFAWNGLTGEDAVNFDCTGQESSLSGSMRRALSGPDAATIYLGLDKIKIVTTDQHVYSPEASPSFATLLAIQDARANPQAGLGVVWVLIAIAGIAISITVAIVALLNYLEKSNLQEETTKRTQAQSQAFAVFTAARLQCYSACKASGKSDADCVATCAKLVDAPKFDAPPGTAQWGLLQYVGATVVIGGIALVGWKLYERKQMGQPIFPGLLPSGHDEHEPA